MNGFFNIVLWTLVTFSVGFNVLVLLDRNKLIKGIEAAGVSFLLGIGMISLQMFILGVLGLSFGLVAILSPWIILLGYNLFFARKLLYGRLNLNIILSSKFEKIIFGFLSFQVIYTFFRALIKPMESYDSVSINALKSKILYLRGTISPGFFEIVGKRFHGAHADYPLLVSFSETWVYVFINSFNDFLAKWIFPLMFLAFLAIFYSMLTKVLNRRILALLFTFLLASIAQFNAYATIGSSDLPMGIYFFLSLSCLYLWFLDTKLNTYFYLSLIFSALSLWTKNEGLLLVLINVFVMGLFLLRNLHDLDKRVTRHAVFYILVVGLVAFAWISYKRSIGLVNENFNFSMININNFIAGFKRIPVILYEYQKHIFGFKKWNIIWLIMLVLLFRRPKQAFSQNMVYITMAISLFFTAYSLVYMLSNVEIHFFLRTTTSRFLLHILPVCVFWIASMAEELEVLWER